MKTIEVNPKSLKRTTYSLDWNVVIGLESRLLRDFQNEKSESKGRELLMVSIGVRLGLRVVDNLSLKWCDLMDLKVGEKFIRIEKKTNYIQDGMAGAKAGSVGWGAGLRTRSASFRSRNGRSKA